jgi:hypothetical protein
MPIEHVTLALVVTAAAVGDLGHLEDDVAAVAHDLRVDLDQLFLQLVSDQSLIGSGVASVRKKLPRL